jgi:hypothetical protein
LKAALKRYAGEDLEIRFLTLNEDVRLSFERSLWDWRKCDETSGVRDGGDVVFDVIQHALRLGHEHNGSSTGTDEEAIELK